MKYRKSFKKISKQDKEFLSIDPGCANSTLVVDGDIKYAIKRWKRKNKEFGIIDEVFNRRQYTKPSKLRRDVILNAEYNQMKSMESRYE